MVAVGGCGGVGVVRVVGRLLGRGGAGGGALPLPPLGPRIWKRELRREGVRVLGVRKLRGAKGGLSGRVPELEEALRGIVAGARGGGRGGGGGRPESVSASEGTTAVGREPRAMAVSRPRLSALFPSV